MSSSGSVSEQRLRLKGLQEEVKYHRAVACLRSLRANEVGSKQQATEYEKALWREVSQRNSPSHVASVAAALPVLAPFGRLKHQQQLLSKAKQRHRALAQECREQGIVVERCGLLREKIAQSLASTGRLRSSRLQSRLNEELCEAAALRCITEGAGVRLRLTCALPGGVSAQVSLRSSHLGAISAMVESPSMALVGRLQSQRFAIEAALRARGISIEALKVRRFDDAEAPAINTTMRESRARVREEDEDGIA